MKTKDENLSENWEERIKILKKEGKKYPKDKIVDIDLNFKNPKENIVGKALMNSVERETYNYIVIKTIFECERDVKEFIQRRIERTKLICKLYQHKQGEELAAELNEDLIKDAGEKLSSSEEEKI